MFFTTVNITGLISAIASKRIDRKIKSLLYIQRMTGVRRLAWGKKKKNYNAQPHDWRTLWFIVINGTCPCSTFRHSCQHAQPPHTSFSQMFRHRKGKYTVNTARITSMGWKAFFSVGKLRFLNFLCQNFSFWLLDVKAFTFSINSWKNLIWKDAGNDKNMFKYHIQPFISSAQI